MQSLELLCLTICHSLSWADHGLQAGLPTSDSLHKVHSVAPKFKCSVEGLHPKYHGGISPHFGLVQLLSIVLLRKPSSPSLSRHVHVVLKWPRVHPRWETQETFICALNFHEQPIWQRPCTVFAMSRSRRGPARLRRLTSCLATCRHAYLLTRKQDGELTNLAWPASSPYHLAWCCLANWSNIYTPTALLASLSRRPSLVLAHL